jgi:hypothetical protein
MSAKVKMQRARCNQACPLANINLQAYLRLAASCGDKTVGACCRGMADDSDHHKDVDAVITMLNAVYCREGADGAVQTAKHMIAVAAALLTCEHGPDETRRILQIVGKAQGKTSRSRLSILVLVECPLSR